MEFEAIYYDGQSSAQHRVRVSCCHPERLEITGLQEPLQISMADVKVSARIGDSARFLRFRGGATCETTNNDAVDRLLKLRGSASGSRLAHWLESHWGIALLCVLLTALACLGGVKWGIPWGAKKVAYAIPIETLQDMSAETLDYMDGLVFEPSRLHSGTKERLRARFLSLCRHVPDLRLNLNFRSGARIGPNAFALPDGSIVVTDELVRLSSNDEQILSVLAHEIGHVHARHALRSLLETSALGLLLSAVTGDISSSVSAVGALPAVFLQAKYSRELETEADDFALSLMANANIEKRHFADIMDALAAALPDHSNSMLSSHPPSQERIKRFR